MRVKICTICGAKWRDADVCPLDGGRLGELRDPLIGRKIADRYEMIERIGAGGMGTVYRARHELVGRDVAIKLLASDLAADPTNRQRFLREAKAANRIDHPHVIDITDYGETADGLVYLVMEYLDGEPLSALIERGPLAVWRAVDIAMQITSALARAHELEVVHRDIKPENVYLLRATGSDFVKLLDFGLAKMQDAVRLTATGSVFGTPEYMAPEQARGIPLNGKADLYALGCVIFEMLSGTPPFSGSLAELVLKHIREPAPSLLERVPDVPASLDALVARLLEKEPARRHRDAYEVLDELASIAEQLPRPSRAPPPRPVPAVTTEPADTLSDWRARVEALRARFHPKAPPPPLAERFAELDRTLAALDAHQRERDELARVAEQRQDEATAIQERLAAALDVLGEDEARVTAELEALELAVAESAARLAAHEDPLRAAWSALPGDRELTRECAEALRDLGRLAEGWLHARDALDALTSERARREGERDDLSFQIEQLQARLGALGTEVDRELAANRDRRLALDEAIEELVAVALACAAAIEEHGRG